MKTDRIAAIMGVIFCVLFASGGVFADTGGKIVFVSGVVTVQGKSAKIGDTVSVGDELTTGENASCDITVGDTSIIRMKDNTRIVFRMDDSENSAIDVMKGFFAAIFRKKPVKIKTSTVIAGVRGTSFCINVESDDSVYACTCNGTIDWTERDQGQTEVVTAHHHAARYHNRVNGKTVTTKADMKYHTDRDIEELAAKINAKIDWTKPE